MSVSGEAQPTHAPSSAMNTTNKDEKDVAASVEAAGTGHEPVPTPMPQETYKQLNELPKALGIVLWLL